MSDKDKIKALLQTNQRHNQIIAIQLMCSLEWLLDDCALFCFLNIKPKVFFSHKNKYWSQSQYKVGNYDIIFSRESKNNIVRLMSTDRNSEEPKDIDNNYRCTLTYKVDNIVNGQTYSIDPVLTGKYPMELNPPVLKYFGAAVLLNLE